MNDAPPPKRHAPKRIAAATAAVVGAALLTYPGAATAQDTGIDCAVLGDDPVADGVTAALELAQTCLVEVRDQSHSGPYETVYVTPEGQLHLVATSGAVQEHPDAGVPDPTLALTSGTLSQTESGTPFTLRYDNPDAPLIATAQSKLKWTGTVPVPSYSGTAAVYDELAPGLDLAVDVGVSSAGLRFTMDGAEAWDALDTGLAVAGLSGNNGTLYGMVKFDDYTSAQNWTTPLTVRDAAGTVTPVTVVRNADFTLTLSLPAGALESAQYPLTLSTEWTQRSQGLSEWGAVTSSSPDQHLLRGEGGLDTPYFEAGGESGDAVVGPYCDKATDPECATTAQAASYWTFWLSLLANYREKPSTSYTFKYLPASATFRVDAAAGTDCVAPELRRVGYVAPSTRWADRPMGASSVPIAGACTDGTAVYDVSGQVPGIGESYWNDAPVYFGMPANAETARFDGDSARLDVYFDILGYSYYEPDFRLCSDYPPGIPWHDSTPRYGGFRFDAWQADRLDYGFTWTATFKDARTGATVLTTDPVPVEYGSRPTRYLTAGQALDDGWYEIVYKFTSSSTGFSYSAPGCDIGVDTQAPEYVDVTVEDGPHYVGDTVAATVKVADESFPDSINSLTIACLGTPVCDGEQKVVLTDTDTATFKLKLEGTNSGNLWVLEMFDEAGHRAYSDLIPIPVTHSRNDFNRDGFQDLMAVRKSDGTLRFHAGKGDGTFGTAVSLGAGWAGMDVAMAGDLNEDGKADLLARDTKTGTLYLYPGNGSGGLGARKSLGTGWNGMGPFTSAGDFDFDGHLDILAVRKADAKLYLYPGRGDGTFGARTTAEDGYHDWSDVVSMTTVGDTELRGVEDLLIEEASGRYVMLAAGSILKNNATTVLDGSLGQGTSTRYTQVTGVGDIDGDSVPDVVATDSRTGELELHTVKMDSSEGTASALRTPRVVGTGWRAMRLPTSTADRTYDFNGDATSDLVTRKASNGTLYLHEGNRSGFFDSATAMGTGWSAMNLVTTAGDMTGDGVADLLARASSTGVLYVYPGNGTGGYRYSGRVTVGSGWNAMSAIMSGYDMNSDGIVDLIARERSTGYVWLYPGKGNGAFGARVKIGTGWNAMREITVAGDLDHDGHADVVAIRGSDNCMYFYGGRGDGTLKPGAKMSCNWVGYDSVTAVADFSGDGNADWVARRQSDGALYLYRGNGAGGYSSRAQIGTGWNSMNIIA